MISAIKCPSCGASQVSAAVNCEFCNSYIIIDLPESISTRLEEAKSFFNLQQYDYSIESLSKILHSHKSFEAAILLNKSFLYRDKHLSKNVPEIKHSLVQCLEICNDHQTVETTTFYFDYFNNFLEKVIQNKNSASSVGSSHILKKIAGSCIEILDIVLYKNKNKELVFLAIKIWLAGECYTMTNSNTLLKKHVRKDFFDKHPFGFFQMNSIKKHLL